MFFRLAVVDDEEVVLHNLKERVEEYEAEYGEDHFEVFCFSDALSFLKEDFSSYDVIFLDIQMPGMSGMNLARKIREENEDVLIVFVTNMAQYAVESYEVHAYDFMLKPVDSFQFSLKMKKIIRHIRAYQKKIIGIEIKGDMRFVNASEIRYIEIQSHNLIIHLKDEKINAWGSLQSIAGQLENQGFEYCNRCYLVNLQYVTGIVKKNCCLGEEELLISRYKRKNFLAALARFHGRKDGGG